MYITDRVEVGIRSGIGIEQRIISTVRTGDQVEWLEGDKNWSKVRLADKTVGWIATSLLVDQIKPSNITISTQQEELKILKEKTENLYRENQLLNQEKEKLIKEVKKLSQPLQSESTTPPTTDLVDLQTKNRELGLEIDRYKKQIDELNQKRKDQLRPDPVKLLVWGIIVLGLGIVLGRFSSRRRRRAKRYY